MTPAQTREYREYAKTCPDRHEPKQPRSKDSDTLLAFSLALPSCGHKDAKVTYCCSACPALAKNEKRDMIAETRARGLLV